MDGPVLTIHGNVGAVTGKVRHDGDVRVLGSITPGFEVAATGNVFVAHDVRNAQAFAGKGLVVNGIATGEETVLDAVETVILRQAVDIQAIAGVDVVVRTTAVRARLSAGRRILLTSAPGIVRGGSLRAGLGVEVSRLRTSAGQQAEVVVGKDPFEEDREEIEERLEFARRRVALTVGDSPEALADYRKQVAQLAAFRNLCVALVRKLKRFDAAKEISGIPYLRVSGPGPVEARVVLGRVEAAHWAALEWQTGEMAAALIDGEVQVKSLRESARVG